MRKDTNGFIQYDCRQCAATPAWYDALGHDGPPQGIYRDNKVTGEELLECPVMTLLKAPRPLQAELIRMENEYFPLFEAGFLLEAGGVVDQSSRYLDWMRKIRETRAAVQAAYVKPASESEGA